MTGHATFQIELGAVAVLSAGAGNRPIGMEVARRNELPLCVTIVAVTDFVADTAFYIRKMGIGSVPGNIITRMRRCDLISVVAPVAVHHLALIGVVAQHAARVAHTRSRNAVAVGPIQIVVAGSELVGL